MEEKHNFIVVPYASNERVRNREYKLQPVATAPALYCTPIFLAWHIRMILLFDSGIKIVVKAGDDEKASDSK